MAGRSVVGRLVTDEDDVLARVDTQRAGALPIHSVAAPGLVLTGARRPETPARSGPQAGVSISGAGARVLADANRL
jgi:hypothetical protein